MKAAAKTETDQPTVVRTGRGLRIAGTRITLYDVMDYVTAGWPREQIQECLRLTERQIADVMDYIEAHYEEVQAEYQIVLKRAEEIRQYWEERNRERFAQIAAMPPKPGQEHLRAKLDAWKARLDSYFAVHESRVVRVPGSDALTDSPPGCFVAVAEVPDTGYRASRICFVRTAKYRARA